MKAKRILTITMATLIAICSINAQEIYKKIFANAEKVVNDPSSNPFIVEICNFEMMALKYMKSQAIKENTEVSTEFLDNQSYYMTMYINSFFGNMGKLKDNPKEQKKMIYDYIKTSTTTPMFNDPDRETTECFTNDSTSVVKFSMNTDWEKAYKKMNN